MVRCTPNAYLVLKKKILCDDLPFAEGNELIVDVPVDLRETSDVYIDNTISCCVDLKSIDNATRLKNAILLAIYASVRPVHKLEHIPRDEMAALAKFLAEASLEETKMILGLFFNFKNMTVALPDNYVAWKKGIV